MSETLIQRIENLRQQIRAVSETLQDAREQLERAEEMLEAEMERLEPIINQDPRFLAAQTEFDRFEAEAARRTGPNTQQHLAQAIHLLVLRFSSTANPQDLTSLTESELRSRALAAYKNIRKIRNSIASSTLTSARSTSDEARKAVQVALDRLDTLRDELRLAESELHREEGCPPEAAESHRSITPKAVWSLSAAALIEQYAKLRGISELVHFTRLANLPSILQSGLIPRAKLERDLSIAVDINDELRIDGRRDCSCLSITRINTYVFYTFSHHRARDADWCIIHFDSSIIWKLYSIFCATNAATTGAVAEAEKNGWTVAGLQALFQDPVVTNRGEVARSALAAGGLPSNVTSNPQAEVLVRETIEPSFIRSVTVRHRCDEAIIRQHGGVMSLPVSVNEAAFANRADHSYWLKYTKIST